MKAVAGLLVMLLGVAHGVETSCDGRQDGTQCYGALGETVVVQLMDSASGIARIEWKKEKTLRILRMVNNYTTFDSVIQNRSFFTPSNGTLRINNLIRNDSGEYTLGITNEQGKLTEQRTLQLTVQAPVSSVQLVSECLSQGQIRVSCSSEGGDSPQYSWTLDGHTLTDAELLSGNSVTNIITLKRDISGHLVCSVRNHVSSISRGETISTCGVDTYCDGRHDGAECYGALGGAVVVQLMNHILETHTYRWIKNTVIILFVRKNIRMSNRLENRSFFNASDGTLRISNLRRTDSGEYTLQSYDSDGRLSEQRTLQLSIQAPVSSVRLVSECLSQGEMRVSCSSEGGDSPQYSWTLDGHTLTDAELLSGNYETNIITLKRNISGHLVCSVRNHVSSVSRGERTSSCKGHFLVIFGLRAAVPVLSFAAIAAYFNWKKRKYAKVDMSATPQVMEMSETVTFSVDELRSSSY